jgi:septal ring factor EnvC (AmiA/AmiB activator)
MYETPEHDIANVAQGLSKTTRDRLEKMAKALTDLERRCDRHDAALVEAAATMAKNFAELNAINERHAAVYASCGKRP